MNFSEFAQLLYPYKGAGKTQTDFLVDLVRQIMTDPILGKDKEMDNNGKYNPLDDLKPDSVYRIYSGNRFLSKMSATKVLDHLDREKFVAFIEDTPTETLELIETSLRGKGDDIPDGEISSVCAKLFISILKDCASTKRKPRQKTSGDQAPQFVQTANLTSSAEASTSVITIDSPAKKVRSVWDSGPPIMPEDFYECFDKYAIADFIKLDPMNLILINYMLLEKRPDGEAMIKGAIQFVKDTENAMQRAEISFWNEKVCKAISAFAKSLGEYIYFLLENAERSDFTTSPFLLSPIDVDEFERKEIWHRKKLQSIYRQITDVESRWHGHPLQMFVNFPGK